MTTTIKVTLTLDGVSDSDLLRRALAYYVDSYRQRTEGASQPERTQANVDTRRAKELLDQLGGPL